MGTDTADVVDVRLHLDRQQGDTNYAPQRWDEWAAEMQRAAELLDAIHDVLQGHEHDVQVTAVENGLYDLEMSRDLAKEVLGAYLPEDEDGAWFRYDPMIWRAVDTHLLTLRDRASGEVMSGTELKSWFYGWNSPPALTPRAKEYMDYLQLTEAAASRDPVLRRLIDEVDRVGLDVLVCLSPENDDFVELLWGENVSELRETGVFPIDLPYYSPEGEPRCADRYPLDPAPLTEAVAAVPSGYAEEYREHDGDPWLLVNILVRTARGHMPFEELRQGFEREEVTQEYDLRAVFVPKFQ